MANLKEIKLQITSVKGTQKTTRAMKLVSSAKLKRAEEVAKRSKVYATKLTELLNEIAQKMNNSDGEIDNVFLKAPSESYLINRFNFCCFNKTSCLRSSSLTSTSGRFIAFKSICFPRQEKKINKPKKAMTPVIIPKTKFMMMDKLKESGILSPHFILFIISQTQTVVNLFGVCYSTMR